MPQKKKDTSNRKIISQNRRARYDYFIDETFEAGIMLVGSEVKSLRVGGKVSLGETYAGESEGELYLFNAFIPEYTKANRLNHSPKRPRKLLLKKQEMLRMMAAIARKGVTLIPLSMYFNKRGIVKVEIGIATGKRKVEKRQVEKEREWKREKARVMKDN